MTRGHARAVRVLRAAAIAAAALVVVVGHAASHAETTPPRERMIYVKDPAALRSADMIRGTSLDDDEPDGSPEPRSVYLVLRLGERRLYMMQSDEHGATSRTIDSFPVAIGRKEYATPTGRFEVTDKIVNPDFVQFDWEHPETVIRTIGPGPTNPLGPRWIGFTHAYGWGIGFHGTPHPELIGGAVSHGCVRMRNRDVLRVYDSVRVGTPVVVEP